MDPNKEETLRQFCDVTGADENRSRFFLESSNWQLEVALSSFYEHGGHMEEVGASANHTPAVPLPPMSDSDMESPHGSPASNRQEMKTKAMAKGRTKGNFVTMNSLQQDSSSDEEEDTFKGRSSGGDYATFSLEEWLNRTVYS